MADARRVDLDVLRSRLRSSEELALLDVRENGVYTQSHAFPAVSAPLSQLDFIVDRLVPRRSVPIVLMDGEDGLAALAAERLRAWDYTDVSILEGGFGAWKRAGLELFSGQYVPSKAFGEYVSEACGTPAIKAPELKKWMDEKRAFSLIDCRPYEEFTSFALPGSVNCAGAELPRRSYALSGDGTRPIVVTCAGRTRGIVATQALINTGIPNPVYVLDDGTAAWLLMGEELERGRTAVQPPPLPGEIEKAIEASGRMARRYGVEEIDGRRLDALVCDGSRTTYVFDVRSPEEYATGHLPGSRSAPGGQLVQSVDHYMGVRNARVVLVDDDGVRSRFTASWLRQMGLSEVYVLSPAAFLKASYHERGPEPHRVQPAVVAGEVQEIDVLRAASLLASERALLLDFQDSLGFKRGHARGAWFAVRSRLPSIVDTLSKHDDVICTSGDGVFARRAALELTTLTPARVHVLKGGTEAWRLAGMPMAAGWERALSPADDVWYNPYDFEDLHASLRSYLRWEIDLVDQIKREEFARFDCRGGS